MKLTYLLILAFALLQSSAAIYAQDVDEQDAFVEANILAIFYHELGHAVIDLMEVPIYGQEEDAADVMAVLLINELFEEQAAQSIAFDSAFGYINDPDMNEEVSYWDVHGPDEQRFYNHVCLFYGAKADAREELANELGLPEERAESCPEEFEQAYNSWSVIFDEMRSDGDSDSLVLSASSSDQAQRVNQLLQDEVASINSDFTLPGEVTISVASCGEANAFYDPNNTSITFCTEFVPHLEQLFEATFTH